MPFTILITGFEPFGGSDINPSAEAVHCLKSMRITGAKITTAILPVVSGQASRRLLSAVRRTKPDAVVCLGESGKAACVTIERLAANLCDYRIADNKGITVIDEPVVNDGPAAYFATLPVRAMSMAIRDIGIPAELSMSAGTFLCNEVMYSLLHETVTRGPLVPAGFIHLPPLPAQVVASGRERASMPIETTVMALRAALRALVDSAQSTKPRTNAKRKRIRAV
ncbi:MAG: pyroglutamyl-peptidase I [Phycisphaerae bacterium]|nr:pyroglutamyl-peptidase I [Phycisphaerae bacterium]